MSAFTPLPAKMFTPLVAQEAAPEPVQEGFPTERVEELATIQPPSFTPLPTMEEKTNTEEDIGTSIINTAMSAGNRLGAGYNKAVAGWQYQAGQQLHSFNRPEYAFIKGEDGIVSDIIPRDYSSSERERAQVVELQAQYGEGNVDFRELSSEEAWTLQQNPEAASTMFSGAAEVYVQENLAQLQRTAEGRLAKGFRELTAGATAPLANWLGGVFTDWAEGDLEDAEAFNAKAEEWLGEEPAFMQRLAGDVAETVAHSMTSMAPGLLTKNPNVGLMSLYMTAAGLGEAEAQRQGEALSYARDYGRVQAAIEAGTEGIFRTPHALVDIISGKSGLIEGTVNLMARELPSEVTATILQGWHDMLTVNPEMTGEQLWWDTMYTIPVTIASVGAQGSITKMGKFGLDTTVRPAAHWTINKMEAAQRKEEAGTAEAAATARQADALKLLDIAMERVQAGIEPFELAPTSAMRASPLDNQDGMTEAAGVDAELGFPGVAFTDEMRQGKWFVGQTTVTDLENHFPELTIPIDPTGTAVAAQVQEMGGVDAVSGAQPAFGPLLVGLVGGKPGYLAGVGAMVEDRAKVGPPADGTARRVVISEELLNSPWMRKPDATAIVLDPAMQNFFEKGVEDVNGYTPVPAGQIDEVNDINADHSQRLLSTVEVLMEDGARTPVLSADLQPGTVYISPIQRTQPGFTQEQQDSTKPEEDYTFLAKAAEILQKKVTEMGLDYPIVLTGNSLQVAAHLRNPAGEPSVLLEPSTVGRSMSYPEVGFIAINPAYHDKASLAPYKAEAGQSGSTLFHELGHSIFITYMNRFGKEYPQLHNMLRVGYGKYLQRLGMHADVREGLKDTRVDLDLVEGFLPPVPVTPEDMADMAFNNGNSYILSLDEHVAEIVSSSVLEDVPAIVQKFRKGARAELEKYYEALRGGRPFVAEKEFQTFLDVVLNIKELKAQQALTKEADRLAAAAAAENLNTPQVAKATKKVYDLVRKVSNADFTSRGTAEDDANYREWKNLEPLPPEKVIAMNITRYNYMLHHSAGTLHMLQRNLHVPGAKEFLSAFENFWQTKMNSTIAATEVLEDWKQHFGSYLLNKDKYDSFDAFLARADEMSTELGRALYVVEMAELAADFNLNNEDINLAERVWGQYRDAMTQVEEALISQTQHSEDDAITIALQIDQIKTDFENMRNRNYMPHTRFGRYVLAVTAKEPVTVDGRRYKKGETIDYELFEGSMKRFSGMKQLEKIFKEDPAYAGKVHLIADRKLDDTLAAVMGLPLPFIQAIRHTLNLTTEQNAELDQLITTMLPGQGFRKKLLKRKGIAGYDTSARRVFADYFNRFANHLARVKHMHEVDWAIEMVDQSAKRMVNAPSSQFRPNVVPTQDDGLWSAVPKPVVESPADKRRRLQDWMVRQKNYLNDPGEEYSSIRAFGFLWYLGYVPKSALINLSQVPLVTFPHFAAMYGDGAAMSMITRAQTDLLASKAGRGKVATKLLSMEELELLDYLVHRGQLKEGMVTELAAVSAGNGLLNIAADSGGAVALRKLAEWGAYLFQTAEVVNRYTTALAGYRLARRSGMNHQDAINQAEKDVQGTQFEYARWNRAPMMQGWKSVPFLFYQYVTNMMYFLGGDPGRWRYLGMMLLLAGLSGLPGAENVMDMYDFFVTHAKKKMGVKDPKTQIRLDLARYFESINESQEEWMPDLMRPENLMKGLTGSGSLGGVDLHASLSFGKILPFDTDAFSKEGSTDKALGGSMQSLAGAPAEIIINMIKAIGSDEPDQWRRWERAMPTEAKNISKALRHFIRGGETDYKGRMLYEYDFEDPWTYVKVMGEAAGFPQHSGVVLREKQFQKRDLVKYWDLAAKKVYDDHYFLRNSVRDGWGKEEDLERFMDEGLKSYNDAVPFNSLKLSPKDLIKSFIARKEGERTEDLKGTTRKKFTPLARTVDEVYEEKLEDIQK